MISCIRCNTNTKLLIKARHATRGWCKCSTWKRFQVHLDVNNDPTLQRDPSMVTITETWCLCATRNTPTVTSISTHSLWINCRFWPLAYRVCTWETFTLYALAWCSVKYIYPSLYSFTKQACSAKASKTTGRIYDNVIARPGLVIEFLSKPVCKRSTPWLQIHVKRQRDRGSPSWFVATASNTYRIIKYSTRDTIRVVYAPWYGARMAKLAQATLAVCTTLYMVICVIHPGVYIPQQQTIRWTCYSHIDIASGLCPVRF